MAKEKKKASKPSAKGNVPKQRGGKGKADAASPAAPLVAKALKTAKSKVKTAAKSPVVAEVVAATLVAAAAALRDPKRARAMAAEVAEDLQSASRQADKKAGAFWQMALDIAAKSIGALPISGDGTKGGKAKQKGKAAKNKKG